MNINDIIKGVNASIHELNTPIGSNNHDHVDRFQNALVEYLQSNVSDYDWKKETKMFAGKHGDRADIYGGKKNNSIIQQNGIELFRIHENGKYFVCEKTCDDDWVIEIDAQRADQIAPKFLSRLALLGLSNKTIHYVAVLYEFSHSNVPSCIKYGKYAYEILRKVNKKSSFNLIIVNQSSKSARIINLKQSSFEIKFNGKPIVENNKSVSGMSEVVIKVIEDYITKRNTSIDFHGLKKIFGKFVADEVGKSRYHETNMLLGNITVYTYTQWRNNYGEQHNWLSFVKLCSQLGYSITEVFK